MSLAMVWIPDRRADRLRGLRHALSKSRQQSLRQRARPPVADRQGHDRRYCLDTAKLQSVGWTPRVRFEEGLAQTVDWYRRNDWWWRPIKETDPAFREYYAQQYEHRRT